MGDIGRWKYADLTADLNPKQLNTEQLVSILVDSLSSPENVTNPINLRSNQAGLLSIILSSSRRLQETSAAQIIALLQTFHPLCEESTMYSVINYLLYEPSRLGNSELFALYKLLLEFGIRFKTEMEKIIHELLARSSKNKLDELQLLQLITWLIETDLSPQLQFLLGKLYENLKGRQLRKTRKRTKKVFGMVVCNGHRNAFPESVAKHKLVNCDGCGREEFTGPRYHCKTCDDFDFCQHCQANFVSGYLDKLDNIQHERSHVMEEIVVPIQTFQVFPPPSRRALTVSTTEVSVDASQNADPRDFFLDVQLSGALQDRIRAKDASTVDTVDSTIVMLRSLPVGRAGAVYASIQPFDPDHTRFIGILNRDIPTLPVNFAKVCALFQRSGDPPLAISQLRFGACLKAEDYCVSKMHRHAAALRSLYPKQLTYIQDPSMDVGNQFETTTDFSVGKGAAAGSGKSKAEPVDAVVVCTGMFREFRVNPDETFGHFKDRVCKAFDKGNMDNYEFQNSDFQVFDDSSRVVESVTGKANVLRLANRTKKYGVTFGAPRNFA
mmetsp:Transcript_34346/g.96828  ORF Transcript_34346/g.96828 Transcript_34346/m.96828 type:complete len:553 (+) Transcript_34346:246-1904(+)